MPATGRRHLVEVDLFRLLTFACVIGVHTLAAATTLDNVASDALQTLLHATREAFFVLTGFVLTLQTQRRPERATAFWRRRLPLVAVPYLTWSIGYSLLDQSFHPLGSPGTVLARVAVDVAGGTGWFHLYFLLVTLQLYLVFPAVVAGLRRLGAVGHAVVLAVALVAQIGVDLVLVDPPAGGFGAFVLAHGYATLAAYPLYPLLGAVAALHRERLETVAARHRAPIAVLVTVAAGVAVGDYLLAVHRGVEPSVASGVFQPAAIGWFVAAVLGLYALSAAVTARWRPDGPARAVLARASDRSFAIFLVHPLVLAGLLAVAGGWVAAIGSVGTLAVLYLGTVVGSALVADLLRRLPVSLALTGRPWRERGQPAVATAVDGPGSRNTTTNSPGAASPPRSPR